LKRADVGIAVKGATDAARASSDIVLTREGLSTIAVAILVSRKIFARMQNFVIYRVACTWQLLFFFLVSCIMVQPNFYRSDWPEHFSMPVIALVTITILNDGTIISVAFDNVKSSVSPEKWDLPALFAISSSIGFVALISSLLLLQAGMNSNFVGGWFDTLGIPPLEYGQLMTMMYLKVSLSDYLSLFNARTRSWMWSRPPSSTVVVAGIFATTVATLLSIAWPFGCGMASIPPELALIVWVYTVGFAFLQDAAKVATYSGLQMYGMMPEKGNAKSEDIMNYLENSCNACDHDDSDTESPAVIGIPADKAPKEDTPLLLPTTAAKEE